MQSNVSFYRGGRGKCDPRAEEGDVKIEAETRVMWEEAKECWQPLEAERGKEHFLRASRGSTVLPTWLGDTDFRLLGFQTE